LEDFRTENLDFAIQFRPFFPHNLEILKSLDTLKLDGVDKEVRPDLQTMKIASVEMDYTIDRNRIAESSVFKNSVSFGGSHVMFSFNVLPVTVHSMTSISCDRRTLVY
jgi:hypothetical protein